MLKGLFYNQKPDMCSIYESGAMSYKALSLSEKYSLKLVEGFKVEVNEINENYDFVIFNYHFNTTKYITKEYIDAIKIPKFTIVTECAPLNPLVWTPKWFTAYLVLDPTLGQVENSYGMPRPLEECFKGKLPPNDQLTIGSFGYPTPGKRFDLVMIEAKKLDPNCIVKINLPTGNPFIDPKFIIEFKTELVELSKNKKINLELTFDFMEKNELIKWCAQNDLNVFFYKRDAPGLSATTDQAISSLKPLLVSEDYTFRHIHRYMKPFPTQSMKEALDNADVVKQIYDDWKPIKFSERFEQILENYFDE